MPMHLSKFLFHDIRQASSKLLLILLWLTSVIGALISWASGNHGQVIVGLSSFVFIVLLIWTLARKKPHAIDLPNIEFLLTPRLGFWGATGLIVTGLGVMVFVGFVIGLAVGGMLISAIVGLAITITWRSRLILRNMVLGLATGLVSALGIAFLGTGDMSWAIFNGVVLPPIFTGGVLLIEHTGFAQSRILQGQYPLAFKSFVWAGVLAIPASLLNLLGNVQVSDTWITHWWQPLYAIVPGWAEETWVRLFLTTLCYAILRPVSNTRPRRAVFTAILIGLFVHGFSHSGIDPIGLIIGSLLYGIPTALLFIKYGFEHAVGYHTAIDFIRFLAALLI